MAARKFGAKEVHVVLPWVPNRFDTFRAVEAGQLPLAAASVSTHSDPERAARLLLALECLRLGACSARASPGPIGNCTRGSTKGWINDGEREALVLPWEGVGTQGDRYAIYGLSGNARRKCELCGIKRFDEGYSDEVRGSIAGAALQEYIRMGVTIRHLRRLLGEIEVRTKLLITLSDGKPDDVDGCRGKYGIEDARRALIEAKRQGIHPFCITIDETARDCLPHMYGGVNHTVIDNITKLPLKVSDIYRRLTT